MLIAKLFWFHIVLLLSICVFDTNAVYPVPGSYYSVLLRYNNRGKNRKGARIGPSPLRLWAYFDPPSVLGSLALGSIDNNLEVHNRKRSVWASQGTVKKANDKDSQSAKDAETILDQIKSAEASSFASGAERAEIRNMPRPLDSIKKDNRKLEDTATTTITSSCGGNEKITLDPYNYVPDSEGRFFYKIIQTIGYPNFYEPLSKCIWNFQIGRECQMGMIIVEFLDGKLIDSSHCQMDSVNILFNGELKKKVCGLVSGTITSLKWTKTGKQLVQVALETKSEEMTFALGQEWGVKISLSGYCWVYAPHFLTQSIAGMKEKESLKRDPGKISKDGDKNSKNKEDNAIPIADRGSMTTIETLKPNTGPNINTATENELLTTVTAMDIESDTESKINRTKTTDETMELTKNESETTEETLLLKSEYETTEESLMFKNEYETIDETLALKNEHETDETFALNSEYESTEETLVLKNEHETTEEYFDSLGWKSESATMETLIKSDIELMTTLFPSRSESENEVSTINNAI